MKFAEGPVSQAISGTQTFGPQTPSHPPPLHAQGPPCGKGMHEQRVVLVHSVWTGPAPPPCLPGFPPPPPPGRWMPATVRMPAVVRMPACHSRRFKGERPIGAATG